MHECVSATATIDAPREVVFAVLADPAQHAAIDGTGWVRGALHDGPVTATGQVFRMAMYHPDHPDGTYQTANLVTEFEAPAVIAWTPGYDTGDGTLGFGGWRWRYDLTPAGATRTEVTLSYDWSAVGDEVRARLAFPPFPPDHLATSLAHLADLVSRQVARARTA